MPVARTEALTKIYGDTAQPVYALNNVNLTVNEGEFLAIMGPSGSGKSTLMYMLGGLDHPTSGKVWLSNHDLSQLNDDALSQLRRTELGFVFQFFNLIPVLPVRDNVALPLILGGTSRAEALNRADDALTKVGLKDRVSHRPAELSGGQQQRVALARALVTNPALIMGDEPTGNLDSRASDEVVQLLRRTADEWGRTVIIVTHDPRIAAYTDRIVFLKDGQIVDENTLKGQGNAEQIREQLGKIAIAN
ncbi:MAG: ABC transporter ATP-binding protein [Anaerolineae bacterium]|nr:ABC transporter ATP-binding protein [Anaerolineae bacterium]